MRRVPEEGEGGPVRHDGGAGDECDDGGYDGERMRRTGSTERLKVWPPNTMAWAGGEIGGVDAAESGEGGEEDREGEGGDGEEDAGLEGDDLPEDVGET